MAKAAGGKKGECHWDRFRSKVVRSHEAPPASGAADYNTSRVCHRRLWGQLKHRPIILAREVHKESALDFLYPANPIIINNHVPLPANNFSALRLLRDGNGYRSEGYRPDTNRHAQMGSRHGLPGGRSEGTNCVLQYGDVFPFRPSRKGLPYAKRTRSRSRAPCHSGRRDTVLQYDFALTSITRDLSVVCKTTRLFPAADAG